MKMRESEIFQEYLKTAEKMGLISRAEGQDQGADAGSKERKDSDEAIGMLYGVQPNGKEDEKHIMEKAHPETVVIAPAYDAINAVVENNIERQRMMAYIATKMPTGQIAHTRYVSAANDLLHTLVRIGFTLDNADEEKLTKLADSCATQVERLEKKAYLPAIILGIGATLGLAAWMNNGSVNVQGIIGNSELLLSALEKVSDSPFASEMIKETSNLKASGEQFRSIQLMIQRVAAEKPEKLNEVTQSYGDRLEKINRFWELYKEKVPGWRKLIEDNIKIEPEEGSYDFMAKLKSVWDVASPGTKEEIAKKGGHLDAVISAITNAQKQLEELKMKNMSSYDEERPVSNNSKIPSNSDDILEPVTL